MPNYIRTKDQGATYFFTVVTYQRRKILTTETARQWLHEAITHVRKRWPLEMDACVLLPDHLHCIWTLPDGDEDFPQRWSQIKQRFTKAFLREGGADRQVSAGQGRQDRKGVWQPRYWEHRIRDEGDFYRHRDYIHLNPVKHGYVENPEDWAWSSFHRHVELGWLDPHWPGTMAVELPDIDE